MMFTLGSSMMFDLSVGVPWLQQVPSGAHTDVCEAFQPPEGSTPLWSVCGHCDYYFLLFSFVYLCGCVFWLSLFFVFLL